VEAIFFEDDVPAEWSGYRSADAEVFADLGSPGGASAAGPLTEDHPLVAARAA
jgi:hypothetical protein